MFILGHLGFTLLFVLIIERYLNLENIDMRFVFVGALIPDILDKILGYFTPIAGRSIFHGFIPIFLLLGVIYFFKKYIFIVLLITSWFHLIFDQMFFHPKILFWPIFGFDIILGIVDINNYWNTLLTSTYVQATEIFGLIILLGFVTNYDLYTIDNIREFLKEGCLGG